MDQTLDTAQRFCSSLCEDAVPRNTSNALTNCTILEQANSRQTPVSCCRNLFGQAQACGNNFKGFGGMTSLVKLAEMRWGYNEVARQHLFLVRMCLKALSCFHTVSPVHCMIILGVTRILSKNQYLFVQVCRALNPDQVFSNHITMVLITTEALFSRFLFSSPTEQ